MGWTVAELREFRQYPQADEVIAKALALAASDVDRVAPGLVESDPDRRDGAIDALVYVSLRVDDGAGSKDPVMQMRESRRARNQILRDLGGIVTVVEDNRRQVYPRRYTS